MNIVKRIELIMAELIAKNKIKYYLKSKIKTSKLSLEYIKNNLSHFYRFKIVICTLIEYQNLDNQIIQSVSDHYANIYRQNKTVKSMEMYTKIVNLIIFHHKVNDDFIRKHFHVINKENLLRYQEISDDIIHEYFNSLDKDLLVQTQTLTESFLLDNFDVFDKNLISTHQPLSEAFMEKHLDKIELSLVGGFFQLSENFIWKYRDHLLLDNMIKYQNLSCDLLDRLLSNGKKINIGNMSWRQDLDDCFIKKYIHLWEGDVLAVEELVVYQILSEEVMNLLIKKDMLSDSAWKYLSRNQKISSEFFKRHRNKIYKCENSVDSLRKYQRVKEISKRANIDKKVEIDIFKFM